MRTALAISACIFVLSLFLLGTGPITWSLAVLLCGAFAAFRYLATGVVGRSFGTRLLSGDTGHSTP
jgi:hypothetical protein